MMVLWNHGVSFTDSQLLIDEYSNEMEFIFDRIPKYAERNKMLAQMADAETLIKSQSKQATYQKWSRDKFDKINSLCKFDKTIFDRLKNGKKFDNTLFTKLKRIRK